MVIISAITKLETKWGLA